jgi:hypothetical protein
MLSGFAIRHPGQRRIPLLVYCIAGNTLLHYSTVLVCRGSFYWPPLYWWEETMNEEEEKIRKKRRRKTNTEEKNMNKIG